MLNLEGEKWLMISIILTYNHQRDTISIEYNCDRKRGYIFKNEKTEQVFMRLTKEMIRNSFSQILKDKKLIGFKSNLEENIEKLYSRYIEVLNKIAEDPEGNEWGWRDDSLYYGERLLTKTLWIEIE